MVDFSILNVANPQRVRNWMAQKNLDLDKIIEQTRDKKTIAALRSLRGGRLPQTTPERQKIYDALMVASNADADLDALASALGITRNSLLSPIQGIEGRASPKSRLLDPAEEVSKAELEALFSDKEQPYKIKLLAAMRMQNMLPNAEGTNSLANALADKLREKKITITEDQVAYFRVKFNSFLRESQSVQICTRTEFRVLCEVLKLDNQQKRTFKWSYEEAVGALSHAYSGSSLFSDAAHLARNISKPKASPPSRNHTGAVTETRHDSAALTMPATEPKPVVEPAFEHKGMVITAGNPVKFHERLQQELRARTLADGLPVDSSARFLAWIQEQPIRTFDPARDDAEAIWSGTMLPHRYLAQAITNHLFPIRMDMSEVQKAEVCVRRAELMQSLRANKSPSREVA